MSPKQKKIAAKAPPPDKIDAKDFAVLKAEKAKGRGMGLQDESIKPGKVMKAKNGDFMSTSMKDARSVAGKSGGADSGTRGENRSKAGVQEIKIKKQIKDTVSKIKDIATLKKFHDFADKRARKGPTGKETYEPIERRKMGGEMKKPMKAKYGKAIKTELRADPTKPISSVAPKASDILKKKKLPGAIGTALGIGAMMVPAAYAAAKQYKDYKSAKNRDEAKVKKMGGGMAKKYSVGGGADMGVKRDFDKITERTKTYAKAESMKDRDRLTNSDIKQATNAAPTEVLKKAKAYYAAYNREARRDLKPSQRKMAGGSVKKYSDGMSYKDMEPYGGKYAKKKNEMKATASENVKRLTTQPSAYDPEARYLVGERRGRNSTTRTIRKTTDQVNLREAANKLKEEAGPGFNVSINTKSDLIRKGLIRPKPMARRMGGGMMNKPMGYKSGTMVKARGCKLGRTRPTKMY
jgi:hypothetical protein